MNGRPLLEERAIEYDALAIVLLATAFVGSGTVVALIVSSAAQVLDASVIAAAIVAGAGIVAGWVFGYPRRIALPAIAFVILCAIEFLPVVFNMDGALMREAGGTAPGRLYLVRALYVGGLGVAFLALLVFGFFAPLAGALQRMRRREWRARETLILHVALTGGALVLCAFPRLGLY